MVRNSTRNNSWIRQGALEKHKIMQRLQISRDFIVDLKQEASFCLGQADTLEYRAHYAGCLAWNQRGDLLANNSDEVNIVVWDVFKKQHSTVKTGHREHILSVKFMPQSDQIVTCSSDRQVRLTDRTTDENLFVCKRCHRGQIESVVVHPREPNLIWSAGERGFISQYDIRQPHVCRLSKPPNLLYDIRAMGMSLLAKCMDANPLRSEILAVGSSDTYTRLFDRRALPVGRKVNEKSQYCVAEFVPGHIDRSDNVTLDDGITALAFNSDGSELVASVQGEHIYLFNTYEPRQKYQSFEPSKKILSMVEPELEMCHPLKRRRHSYSNEVRQQIKLPEELKKICDDLLHDRFIPLWPDSLVNFLSKSLEKVKNCPELHTVYQARALALIWRGWMGDAYQALRDCCCALLLKPLDFLTIRCISASLIRIGNKEDASKWLQFVEATIKQFGNHKELLKSKESLLKFTRSLGDNEIDSDRIELIEKTPLFIEELYHLPDYVFVEQLKDDLHEILLQDYQADKEEIGNRLFDFSSRYCGHKNTSFFSEVNFFGSKDEFIVSGSDEGNLYIWDKNSTNMIKAVQADDSHGLDCLQPHPNICMLATSGHDATVRLWSPIGKVNQDVEHLETDCLLHQRTLIMRSRFFSRIRQTANIRPRQ